MKTLDEMTPAELRKLADKKEELYPDKPVKEGFLKHDLYYCRDGWDTFDPGEYAYWVMTKKVRDEAIKKFADSFGITLSRGTRFECYTDCDGDYEMWYDCGGKRGRSLRVKEADGDWAKEHLEKIRPVGQKSKKSIKSNKSR